MGFTLSLRINSPPGETVGAPKGLYSWTVLLTPQGGVEKPFIILVEVK
jgi:hypothetical protein